MKAVVQASVFWAQLREGLIRHWGVGAEQLLEEDATGKRTDGLREAKLDSINSLRLKLSAWLYFVLF